MGFASFYSMHSFALRKGGFEHLGGRQVGTFTQVPALVEAFNTQIVKPLVGRKIISSLQTKLRKFVRIQTRKEGSHGFFNAIADSIYVEANGQGWVIKVTHRAAHAKEYGADIEAGKGPYSTASSVRRRRGGRAKWLAVPVGYQRGQKVRQTRHVARDSLAWRPPKGQPRRKWGTTNYGGVLVRENTAGQTMEVLFALYKEITLPPHARRRPGPRTGWFVTPQEIGMFLETEYAKAASKL